MRSTKYISGLERARFSEDRWRIRLTAGLLEPARKVTAGRTVQVGKARALMAGCSLTVGAGTGRPVVFYPAGALVAHLWGRSHGDGPGARGPRRLRTSVFRGLVGHRRGSATEPPPARAAPRGATGPPRARAYRVAGAAGTGTCSKKSTAAREDDVVCWVGGGGQGLHPPLSRAPPQGARCAVHRARVERHRIHQAREWAPDQGAHRRAGAGRWRG